MTVVHGSVGRLERELDDGDQGEHEQGVGNEEIRGVDERGGVGHVLEPPGRGPGGDPSQVEHPGDADRVGELAGGTEELDATEALDHDEAESDAA